MKCNYHPPKLTKEEQMDLKSPKSTLPYIDRLNIAKARKVEVDYSELESAFNDTSSQDDYLQRLIDGVEENE